jgi:hypothetical protein
VFGFCVHGNERDSFVKGREFIKRLNCYELLKDSVSCRQLNRDAFIYMTFP